MFKQLFLRRRMDYYSNLLDFAFMVFTLFFYILFLLRVHMANNPSFNKYLFFGSLLKALLNFSLFNRVNFYLSLFTSSVWFIIFRGARNLAPVRLMVSKLPKKPQ